MSKRSEGSRRLLNGCPISRVRCEMWDSVGACGFSLTASSRIRFRPRREPTTREEKLRPPTLPSPPLQKNVKVGQPPSVPQSRLTSKERTRTSGTKPTTENIPIQTKGRLERVIRRASSRCLWCPADSVVHPPRILPILPSHEATHSGLPLPWLRPESSTASRPFQLGPL